MRLSLIAATLLALVSGIAGGQTAATYTEPFRPEVHFSPAQHWTNDPNGLVLFDGEYHLFFQYNPFGDVWGHMSWGHAVSKDLLHWQQLPVAIPEANGEMVFTGSVVIDEHNTSGLCTAHTVCMVAVYTGYTGYDTKPEHPLQTQNLAVSQDHGRTWTRFSGNPVLDLHMADFRDPSVTWQPAQHRWLMAVSLPKEHRVRFYAAPDLKHWTQLSDFGPLGDTTGDWECPDLVELPHAANERPSTPATYALKVGLNPGAPQGGSGEQYFLGSFDGSRFTPSTLPGAHGYTNWGKDDYCAINFNHLPAAEAPVLLGWMSNWDYAAKLPTAPWRGQMSLPRRLTLVHDADGLSLSQQPITAPLRTNHQSLRSTLNASGAQPGANVRSDRQTVYTGTAPAELNLHFTATPTATFTLRLASDDTHATDIIFDLPHHQLTLDRTHAGLQVAPNFPAVTHAPLAPSRPLDLHLVVDRSSVELYAQDGTVAVTDLLFPPTPNLRVELLSTDPHPLTLSGDAWSLTSIWP